MHKFKIGALVELQKSRGSDAPNGLYEVVRLLPSDGTEMQYRIKNVREVHERLATESQLRRT